MIFIATSIDASAFNLGKISIKSISEVSQDTFDMIESYGNRELSDDQIIALDNFLEEFNSKWASKVNCLILPILCGENKTYETEEELKASPAFFDIKNKKNVPIFIAIYGSDFGRLQTTEKGIESVSPVINNFNINVADTNILSGITNNNSHGVIICSKDWGTGNLSASKINKTFFSEGGTNNGLCNYTLNNGSGSWAIINEDKNIYGYSINNANNGFGYNQGVKLGVQDTGNITNIGLVKGNNSAAPGWMAGLSFGIGFDTDEDFNNYCDALYNLYNVLSV